MMFSKKKKETADDSAYTKAEYEAAVKKSICTGEMTFGFIRKADGHFVDIALVRNEEEMKALAAGYGFGGCEIREIY